MKLTDLTIGGKKELLAALFMPLARRIGLAHDRAIEAWSEYGYGFIYAPSGMVLEDSSRNRKRAVRAFGAVVIVAQDGRMMIWSYGVARKIRENTRKRNAYSQRSKETALRNLERKQRCAMRKREEMFETCKGERCPKRQGRAQGIEYVGKYINRYYPSVEQMPGTIDASVLNRNFVL